MQFGHCTLSGMSPQQNPHLRHVSIADDSGATFGGGGPETTPRPDQTAPLFAKQVLVLLDR